MERWTGILLVCAAMGCGDDEAGVDAATDAAALDGGARIDGGNPSQDAAVADAGAPEDGGAVGDAGIADAAPMDTAPEEVDAAVADASIADVLELDGGDDAGSAPTEELIIVYAARGTGALGGRAGADAVCETERATHSELAGMTARALLCVTGPTEVGNFPTLHAVPAGARVLSLGGVQLGPDWAAFTSGLEQSLRMADVLPSATSWTQFFTGCGSTIGTCVHDCVGFTSDDPARSACVGRTDVTDGTWIAWGNILSCDAERDFLCIAHGTTAAFPGVDGGIP